jgi:hypothetical protein
MSVKLIGLYDQRYASELSGFFVECAEMGLTMVAGDPSRFVGPDDHASAVIVGADELTGEGTWSGEHILELARMAGVDPTGAGTTVWSKCPECGHEHYDIDGGVPCAEPSCRCERSYLPRSGPKG